eukprot:gene22305-26754_t
MTSMSACDQWHEFAQKQGAGALQELPRGRKSAGQNAPARFESECHEKMQQPGAPALYVLGLAWGKRLRGQPPASDDCSQQLRPVDRTAQRPFRAIGNGASARPGSCDSGRNRCRAMSAGASLPPKAHAPGLAPAAMPAAAPATAARAAYQLVQAHLHISGFDPRAAGGRQTLKMELRGMSAACAPQLTLRLRSDLIPRGAVQHDFVRTTRGDWRPVFVEFSSRNKEHGQYQIDVEVHSHIDGAVAQKWVCTFVILVPRRDATLTEIHQIFLSTHKNVRVMADDASIARVTGGDGCNLDVTARNAGIAHVDLSAPQGKIDMGFATIAWDEELIEVDLPAAGQCHPHPSQAACLVNAAPEAGEQRQIRLFALEECMLGRFELVDPEADVLLSHFSPDGQDNNGLTRRLSGRHAIIRRGPQGFEIEDVSRYGLLLDGVWPGKHKPVALRLGMRIELSASIKGIVVLSVTAILAHGVILHRIDHGARAECFYLLLPEARPAPASHLATPQAASLPLAGFARHNRFASEPYPECWIIRTEGAALCDSSMQTA